MTNQIERARIFSMMTQSRFLHLEDSLTPIEEGKPGKVRFFIGAYQKGSGQPATTAHHFLDDADARVVFADMSWGKQLDIKDYKGTVNGSEPQSRVLTIKGPKDGKYWVQVSMGPGEVIGQGAVKPAGKPEVEVSIALTTWQARQLALACIEYMSAYRVAALIETGHPPAGDVARSQTPRHVDTQTGEIRSAAEDAEDLFGPEPHAAPPDPEPERSQKAAPAEDKPTSFYELAPKAITEHGLLDLVQELVRGPLPWAEKTQRLQAAMA
jgi:hypothetical protein